MPHSIVEKNNRHTSLLSVVQITHKQQQTELQITAAQKVALLQDTGSGFTLLIIEPQQQ